MDGLNERGPRTETSPRLHQMVPLLVSNATTAIAYYAVSTIIAKSFGAGGFGVYTLGMATASLIATLPNFGLDRLLVRDVARAPDSTNEAFSSRLVLRLILALLAVGGYLIASASGPASRPDRAITTLILLASCANLVSELLRGLLFGHQRMGLEAAVRVAGRAVTIAAVALFAARSLGLVHVVAAFVGAQFVELLAYAVISRKALSLRFLPVTISSVVAIASDSLPLACQTFLVVVYFRFNALLLGHFWDAREVGYFGAAFAFLQLLQFVSGAAAGAALPALASMSHRELGRQVESLLATMMALAVPAAMVLYSSAPLFIRLVFGRDFSSAVPVLQIIVWASVPMFVGSMLGNTLIAVAAQGTILLVALSAAVASIALNLLLIPASGAIGGAIATLATESLVALALLAVVRKRIEVSLFSPALIRVTIGAGAMALCLVVLNAAPVGLRLAVAVAAYLAVCGRMLLRSVWVIRERAADE